MKDADEEQPLMRREQAYRILERQIVTGELAPGQWASETDLMRMSGQSRASVRAAVQRLQEQELISTVPRRGTRICPIDFRQQFRAQELRRVVESLLAACAAERATPAQRVSFLKLAEDFSDIASNQDPIAMIDLDLQHHSLMTEAADNVFAAKAVASVKGLSRRFWILNYDTHGDIARMARSLRSVAQAIGSEDPEAAKAAVHKVVDYIEEFTLQVVGYKSRWTKSGPSE